MTKVIRYLPKSVQYWLGYTVGYIQRYTK